MSEHYFSFCEELWRGWLDARLTASSFVSKVFDLNAAPEPYVSFGLGAKLLVALTTNPGATMRHQCRAAVQAGVGPLREEDKYSEAAPKLGDFYETHLTGQARHRIAKLRKLSSWLGYEGVLQVEACPFHCPSLPQKNALLEEIAKDELLGRYAEQLRAFLRHKSVLSLQAAPTRASLRPETPKSSRWLRWITETAGIDLNNSKFLPLVEKGPKITAAAWLSNKPPVALVLMMGGTGLPADEGLCKLATELQKFWRLR
jgi:hypothetical protein